MKRNLTAKEIISVLFGSFIGRFYCIQKPKAVCLIVGYVIKYD